MTSFFDTSIGKTVKVTLWLMASYIVAYVLAWTGHHQFSGAYTIVPGLINIAAYGFNTAKDQTVPTLPSSPIMKLVPVEPPAPAADQVIQPETPVIPPVVPATNNEV